MVAEKRSEFGKQYAKRIRRDDKIPGVYYAHGEETLPILVDGGRLREVLASKGMIINLDLGGKRIRKSIIKGVQYDPVFDNVLHVDFMGIRMSVEIDVSIPIRLQGMPIAAKVFGGVVQQSLRSLIVRALPADLPDEVVLDISELETGDSLHVHDIKVDKVTVITDPDITVVTIAHPTVEVEAEVAEEVAEEEGEEKPEEAEAPKPEEPPTTGEEESKE